MNQWDDWVGRSETRRDRVDDSAVARWLAALDCNAPADGFVPQAYHWCLCLPDVPTAALGTDGHPLRDEAPTSLLPPVPLPRRMWAASKVVFHRPIRAGQTIIRKSRVASITEKKGDSGILVFVDIVHEIHADGPVAIQETQSVVFREAAPKSAAPVLPPIGEARFDSSKWDAHRSLVPTEPLLFRYSALTYNSHRIHYDLPYAAEEEGYRGLVVHGPLTASLLLDLARRQYGDNALSHFEFRGTSPAIAREELHLGLRERAEDIELGAFASDGRQIMQASARRSRN